MSCYNAEIRGLQSTSRNHSNHKLTADISHHYTLAVDIHLIPFFNTPPP